MGAHSDGVVAFELTPEAFAGAVGQCGVDVSDGVPGRFVELDGAGDGVAEEQGAFLAGRDHHAHVAGWVPRRRQRGDAGSDGGFAVDRPHARGVCRRPADSVVLVDAGMGPAQVEEVRAGVRCDVVAEVARPRDECAVGMGWTPMSPIRIVP